MMLKRETRTKEAVIERREREIPVPPLGNPINYSDMLLMQARSAQTNMGWRSVFLTLMVALACVGATSALYLARASSDDFTEALVDSQMRSGSRLYRAGLFDDAIEEFSTAILHRNDYDLAYYRRGMAYEAKGDRERAITDYRKVLEISSDEAIKQDASARLQGLGVASP
ncbi:MAG TPA: tetratricopeptide repeat protein [Chloroflexia bacterium]|jgi:tetratricopeptide (TPR) repeat protein